ncbi:MAG: pilus assembly protein [Lachnospiraceae bacterium]|nr:pilus assembly protein [Lachnospiraceae bacterium]
MTEKRLSEKKGSITLESALILPVVLYVILLVFCYLMFSYNKSVCRDAALLAARQTVYFENETNRKIERAAADKCTEALTDRLIGVKDIRVTVSTGRFRTEVKVNAKMWFSDTGVLLGTVPFGEIEVTEKAERFRPVGFLYTVKKTEYLTSWIKERKENESDSGIQKGHEPQLPDSTVKQ